MSGYNFEAVTLANVAAKSIKNHRDVIECKEQEVNDANVANDQLKRRLKNAQKKSREADKLEMEIDDLNEENDTLRRESSISGKLLWRSRQTMAMEINQPGQHRDNMVKCVRSIDTAYHNGDVKKK